ncbi:MAG TPA: phosphosulfolactate synthase [Solirubrobacteraceae bacterium]|nr:phosphosulfolactate synthase [Solirubrobacteraceae bacterium]
MDAIFELPHRAAKPRTTGLTHVLDCGLGPLEAQSLVDIGARHIDLVRLGWGSALVTACLERKLELYRAAAIPVMVGGTLTELAWAHGRVDELVAWVQELGIDRIEVSSGTIAIPAPEKARLIERLAARMTVYAEVGEKDPDAIMAPYAWVDLIRQSFEAGAELVVCEGRASGTAGLYRGTSELRTGLVEEIAHEVGLERLVFEAPLLPQQAWFINRFGPEVNLGNIPSQDVVSLESLRLGLRSESVAKLHAPKP